MVASVLLAVVAAGSLAVVDAHPGIFPWAFRHAGDWDAALATRTRGADGLRIHTTGSDRMSWLQPHGGTVLFETRDEEVTREFLGRIRIDSAASGDHCLCMGGTEIDVLRGNSVAVAFLLKHGGALRSGQVWPGDAQLTLDSSDAVCAWLAERGIAEESVRQQAARSAALRAAREAAEDAQIGPERARALRACTTPESAVALLEEWAPDLSERIELAVRFLAVDPESVGNSLDGHFLVGLWFDRQQDASALAAAFDRVLADPAVAGRAAAWYVRCDDEIEGGVTPGALAALRLRAWRLLVASPSDDDRSLAGGLLGAIGGTGEGRALLLDLLPAAGPAGGAAPRASDDQMCAACELAESGDPALLPRLRALADAADEDGAWRRALERAIAKRGSTSK